MRSLRAHVYPLLLFVAAGFFVVLAWKDGLNPYVRVNRNPGYVYYDPSKPVGYVTFSLLMAAFLIVLGWNEIRIARGKPALRFFRWIMPWFLRLGRFIRVRLGMGRDSD